MALTTKPAFDPSLPPDQPQPEQLPADDTYYAGNPMPPERDPEKRWQDYGVQAINQLYPWARNGVDFAWGRETIDDDAHLLEWSDRLAPADEGKIQEAAQALAEADPYGPNYRPRPSLAAGTIRDAPDEVQRRQQY